MEQRTEILVVGTGVGGIGSAIILKKSGFNDFLILEKEQEVGGTWRDHDYPGLTVDIVTSLYSFTFEPNPEWSSWFAPRKELFEYEKHCFDKYGLRPHVRLGQRVEKAEYDEQSNLWRVYCASGDVFISRYLISATGFLNVVKFPEIPGIDDFRGRKLHSSFWKRDDTVKGERVAFIGTGATGIQLIPELAPDAARMDVYQRTPIWLMPRNEKPIGRRMRWAMRHVPGFMKLIRFQHSMIFDYVVIAGALNYGKKILGRKPFESLYKSLERTAAAHVRAQVEDPALQEKLIPRYSLGCKRLSFSDKYYPTFNRDNVELVTDPIARITENGIVTADGKERQVDTLVCATGYEVFTAESPPTFPVLGRGGKELRAFWKQNRFQAYHGVSINGFPNYFIINGPYSVSHASYFAMVEDGIHHIVRCLKKAQTLNANRIEIKAEEMEKDFRTCIDRRPKSVFYSATCGNSNSYYIDEHGDVPTFRTSNRFSAWLRSRTSDLNHYTYESSGSATTS